MNFNLEPDAAQENGREIGSPILSYLPPKQISF